MNSPLQQFSLTAHRVRRNHFAGLCVLSATSAILVGCGGRAKPEHSGSLLPPPARTGGGATGAFALKDSAEALGVRFKHSHGTSAPLTIVETMGGGCAVLDFDGDGRMDLFFTSAGQDFKQERQEPGSGLFRQTESGSFENVTAAAGLTIDTYAMGCCVGDYDNDGRSDLFVTGFGRNQLFHNLGGRFEDVTTTAGILHRPGQWGTGCSFVDIDRDGKLDLYVANYVVYDPAVPLCRTSNTMTGCTPNRYKTQRNELYRNLGGGRFEECAIPRGADDPSGAGLGVLSTDLNNDGWPEILVANDGTPNALLQNVKGKFKNIGDMAGIAYGETGAMRAGMGIDGGDYDGDGKMDITITNFFHEPNSLYRQRDFPFFEDHSYLSGVGTPSINRLGFGTVFVDLDQDGRPDLYAGNGHVFDNVHEFSDVATFEQLDLVLLNQGRGKFQEIAGGGAQPSLKSVARGVAAGDLNNDGAPDLVINCLGRAARVLMNQPTSPRHWLGVSLTGTRSNRSAIGARVEVTTQEGLQVREIRSGGSYCSQSDPRALFGLGGTVDPAQVKLTVRWPGGNRQSVKLSRLDQYLQITEEGR